MFSRAPCITRGATLLRSESIGNAHGIPGLKFEFRNVTASPKPLYWFCSGPKWSQDEVVVLTCCMKHMMLKMLFSGFA